MKSTSGATLPCRRPVFLKPPSSVRSQMCASSIVLEDVRVGDGDLRPEGRVRHHHVHRARALALSARLGVPGR